MSSVYTICDKHGNSTLMKRIQCRSEDLELQRILEKNPNLLPGDQIDPADPRRWLLIKREMPVPDPNTGLDKWSLDFLFVDQDARPTFVECKLMKNSQSRREVVGQMLEYAANGHYYWSKEVLQGFAENTARKESLGLDEAIRSLRPTNDESTDKFFERVQNNLREGQVRLVFFLEDSPLELRSIVDFLNKQMQRSEILLVEARQYLQETTKIVVPTLFGYTEEARRVKRTIIIDTPATKRKWDEQRFFEYAHQKLNSAEVEVFREFYNQCLSLFREMIWGSGATYGTLGFKDSLISQKPLITVTSYGRLYLNFACLNETEVAEHARDRLKQLITQRTSLSISEDYRNKYPGYSITQWGNRAELILDCLKELMAEFQGPNSLQIDQEYITT